MFIYSTGSCIAGLVSIPFDSVIIHGKYHFYILMRIHAAVRATAVYYHPSILVPPFNKH